MRKIVLHYCHDKKMSGEVFTMEDDGVTRLDIPMVCGCVAVFAPVDEAMGIAAQEVVDGDICEVWKQVDFRFCEYREPL